jgi:polysaccharide biosynthesis/export protein
MRKHLIVLSALLFPFTAVFAADSPTKPSEPVIPAETITKTVISPADSTDYGIGVEDVLDIAILQPEKMMITVSVAPDGSVNVPYIGRVYVKGVSLADVQKTIQDRLANGYMQYPVVSVTLRESRSRKFSVYGQVNHPGSYPLSDDSMTVLGAIAVAGGFNVPGSSGTVKIIRPVQDGKTEKIEVKINSVMNTGKDVRIKPGDTLMVYEDKFFIYGGVQRPGPFPLEENTTVLKAISMSGGFTVPGSSGIVKIIRASQEGETEKIEVKVNSLMSSGKDVLIKSGDTLMFTEDKFFVYGEVQRPGSFSLEENTTVLKAISMAGGFTKFGSASRVKCLRPYGNKPGYKTIKLNTDAIMAGNSEDDLVLQTGDIIVVSEGMF